MLHIFDSTAEEALSQTAKFLHRVGGEEFEPWQRPPFLVHSPRQRQESFQMVGNSTRRRFGGVDYAHMRRRHTMQQRLEQRIVSASENQSVRVVEAVGKSLPQINA